MIRIHGGNNRIIEQDHSVNVNPLGMPDACLEALRACVNKLHKYPETDCERLKAMLSERNRGASVILGNGSTELIYALCPYMASIHPGYAAIITAPAFGEYECAVRVSGGKLHVVRTDEADDFSFNDKTEAEIGALLDSGKDIRLVFVCSPSNPAGGLIDREALLRLASSCSRAGAILICDECFLMFCDAYDSYTMTAGLKGNPNVIVLSAFTKFYAMAGLRIGYALSCDDELLNGIRLNMQPWNVSIPAYEAAIAALSDEDYVLRTRRLIRDETEYLTDSLGSLGITVVGDPAADYVLIRYDASLKERLNGEGIDIRDCADMMKFHDTKESYLRMAVMDHEANERLIGAIRRVI